MKQPLQRLIFFLGGRPFIKQNQSLANKRHNIESRAALAILSASELHNLDIKEKEIDTKLSRRTWMSRRTPSTSTQQLRELTSSIRTLELENKLNDLSPRDTADIDDLIQTNKSTFTTPLVRQSIKHVVTTYNNYINA